jgi:hypothetical protein
VPPQAPQAMHHEVGQVHQEPDAISVTFYCQAVYWQHTLTALHTASDRIKFVISSTTRALMNIHIQTDVNSR